jgi:hypothetical protein
MKNFRNAVSVLVSGLRPLAIALACALVIFSSATPAFAFGKGSPSSPTKGLEQLDTVQQKSEEAISGSMDNLKQMKNEEMKNAAEGLNGVQGDANKQNMISREEAKGNTIEKNIKEALEDITP